MDEKYLADTILFRGTSPQEIHSMLDCLQAKYRQYAKGETILAAGIPVTSMGLVLSGSVRVENNDIWGNTSVLGNAVPGEVFAETYACIPDEPLLVNVVAAEASKIVFLNMERLLTPCSRSCPHHSRLIRNLLTISSQKNLNLSRRIFHTSSKTIRGRLLSYLSFQAAYHGSRTFIIPFNRQQLADYLSVERSALSNELSKMQRDGILTVHRNEFCLNELSSSFPLP
ncbi:Crp/Fnr family transcriptional regulator [Anaerolentibacter hominis]|uniref:Crp/Fnr family transcriptional regulator n=1 Tax=Anaerolentibacter hominis TaxID=3079009 RepID=UPI0031B82428